MLQIQKNVLQENVRKMLFCVKREWSKHATGSCELYGTEICDNENKLRDNFKQLKNLQGNL